MKWYIGKSKIHGNGTFCAKDVPKNTDLGLSIPINSETSISKIFFRNTFGLLVNDSKIPNAKTVRMDDGWHFVSTKPIKKDEEILVDYDEYIDKVDLESFISGKRVSVV
jgi:hypothetical protein